MRAKVVVRPGNAQVIGATMAATDAARKSLAETGMATVSTDARGLSANQLPSSAKPYDIVRSDTGTWIAAPCANPDIPRWWLIASNTEQADEQGGVSDNDNSAAAWRAQEIEIGREPAQAGDGAS